MRNDRRDAAFKGKAERGEKGKMVQKEEKQLVSLSALKKNGI